ncbi:hypothetical protein [Dyadobacter sp. 676]|uniref:Glycosyltransferase RgtA/B/C/D-like domain-containing protein n=1 Tax=Dyadobacter sp. 676 TaxID=3088362 RepID=A0AAU8FH58_9BACT
MSLLVFVTLSVFVGSVSLLAAYLQAANRGKSGYPVLGSAIFRDVLFFLACITPVAIFFSVWTVTTVNIPFQDDIDAILESTAAIADGPFSFREFWRALSRQDDERRIVVVRLVAYLVYLVNGVVDFRVVALVGICSYLVFFKLVLTWFRSERNLPLALLLPIPYVLFSNFNYAALYQAMVPLQHIGVYVWGFASIWFVSQCTRAGLLFGSVFGVLSIYSDVTGIFVGPVAVFILLARRKWLAATFWVLLFGVVTAIYLSGLAIPDFRPTFSQNLSSWQNMLLIAVAMPGMMADVFLEQSDTSRLICSLVAGVASLSLVGSCAFRFGQKLLRHRNAITPTQWWLAGCVLFLLVTFLAFAFGRAAYGANCILLSRYKHMFTFWAIYNYLLLLQWRAPRRLLNRHLFLLQAGALVYFGGSYFQTWGDMIYLRKTIQADAYGWTQNREFPSAPIYITVKKAVDSIFENALKARVYQFPQLPFEALRQAEVRGSSDVIVRVADFIVAGTEAPECRTSPDDGLFLLIHAGNEIHVLPMRRRRSSFLRFMRTGRYYSGYCESMAMPRQYLDKNKKYKLMLGVINGHERYLLATDKEITGS